MSTSPPVPPSPYEVSKERGKKIIKRGFALLGLPFITHTDQSILLLT